MKHLLSVDLEGWVFRQNIEKRNLTFSQLKKLDDDYSPKSLSYLLKILKKHNQKITFFVVGKLEMLYPGTIEKILRDGHEVGWHTHSHPTIDNKEILYEELAASEKIIKQYNMKGFQAPRINFFKKGYKILKDHGFTYSSSIYGNSDLLYKFDDIYEIPVSVMKNDYAPKGKEIQFPSNMTVKNILKFGIPYGSSFFWGILGKQFYFNKLREAEKNNQICNLFIHEWQIMPPNAKEYKDQVHFLKDPLFYPYTINTADMFEYLLANFTFQKFGDYIKKQKIHKRK